MDPINHLIEHGEEHGCVHLTDSNAHYYNEFDVPIQVKVWFNFFPYEGTPEHTVEGLTSLDHGDTMSAGTIQCL